MLTLTRPLVATMNYLSVGTSGLSLLKGAGYQLPSIRTSTRPFGFDFPGRAAFTDGGTVLQDGETNARWSVICSLQNGFFVMLGPVVTSKACFTCAGAHKLAHNMVDVTALIWCPQYG